MCSWMSISIMRSVGNSFRDPPTPALWRTERFRAFSNHILDRLFLSPSREILQGHPRSERPSQRASHSFFPENRRSKPKWKNVDIFYFAGISQFIKDTTG